jgi:hypothetical protein
MVALGKLNIRSRQRILIRVSSPFRATFHFVLKACEVKEIGA